MTDEADLPYLPGHVKLVDRLINWRFDHALAYAQDPELELPESLISDIRALSVSFGDSRFFQGSLGEVVHSAVRYILRRLSEMAAP